MRYDVYLDSDVADELVDGPGDAATEHVQLESLHGFEEYAVEVRDLLANHLDNDVPGQQLRLHVESLHAVTQLLRNLSGVVGGDGAGKGPLGAYLHG